MGETRRIKSGYCKSMAMRRQGEYKKMQETVSQKALNKFKTPPYYLTTQEKQREGDIGEMMVCKEMESLRIYLNENEIEYEDCSDNSGEGYWICRTNFYLNDNLWIVVNGFGTYGGFNRLNGEEMNQGLLELMTANVNKGEPIGCLKAADVIKFIEKERK